MVRIMTVFIVLLITACGGGGGGSSTTGSGTPPATPTIPSIVSGTAATGMAMDGMVNVYGSNGGSILGTPINVFGNYLVDVTGLTAPYFICAEPSNPALASQYSFAAGSGIANITPMTTLALFYANGSQDPAGLISAWPASQAVVAANLPVAQATVNANFVGVFDAINAALDIDFTTYNFFSAGFNIGDIYDQILDLLGVDLSGATPVITVDGNVFSFNPVIDTSGINIGGSGGGAGGLGSVTLTGADTAVIGGVYSPISQSGTAGSITAIAWGNLDGQLTVGGQNNQPSVITFNITRVAGGQVMIYSYALTCALPGNDCSKLQIDLANKQANFNNLVMQLSGAANNQATGQVTLNGALIWN